MFCECLLYYLLSIVAASKLRESGSAKVLEMAAVADVDVGVGVGVDVAVAVDVGVNVLWPWRAWK